MQAWGLGPTVSLMNMLASMLGVEAAAQSPETARNFKAGMKHVANAALSSSAALPVALACLHSGP